MADSIELETMAFPSRMAELGFSARLPVGWIRHELPEEDLDFANPVKFAALAVVTAPHATIVFAFAARPAYDDGTVLDWTRFLLEHNGMTPQTMGEGAVGTHPAMLGEATQPSELGPMKVRFAFFEDGGRLLNITLSAPEMLAGAVYGAWTGLLGSFRLETPRGAGAAVQPAVPVSASVPLKFADFALAEDAATLDPEHPINANLRDRGVGLVPNVAAIYDAGKWASVRPGALVAQISIPYGWHVIDDGKRTLVFDAANQVQISLNLVPREGRSDTAVLDDIEAQARSDYPTPKFLRLNYEQIQALGIRNIADGDQPIEQYHMLVAGRDAKTLLRARVTAPPEHRVRAVNLAQLVLDSVAFDASQQQDEPGSAPAKAISGARKRRGATKPARGERPKWLLRALELEAADQLEQAEQAITQGAKHIAGAAVVADMYQSRMVRMLESGDKAGAIEAFRKADEWIFFYASQATSGGEGAALSLERDQFRAGLVSALGHDPQAK